MRQILLITAIILFSGMIMAQQERFLVFEFMKVADNQEADYWETETFWEKIHAERVKTGEIKGWDLWSLKPGGSDQGYQYVTVTIYDNAVSAMEGGDIWEAAKKAYPLIADVDLDSIIQQGLYSRELSKRLFLKRIATTRDDFEMELGSVMRMNFMDALPGKYKEYEKAEIELFLPMHQQLVDDGIMSHWALARLLMPSGSKVKTTHLTFDMFSDYQQYFDSYGIEEERVMDPETQKKVEVALKTRDLNWTYVGTMVKTVKYTPPKKEE